MTYDEFYGPVSVPQKDITTSFYTPPSTVHTQIIKRVEKLETKVNNMSSACNDCKDFAVKEDEKVKKTILFKLYADPVTSPDSLHIYEIAEVNKIATDTVISIDTLGDTTCIVLDTPVELKGECILTGSNGKFLLTDIAKSFDGKYYFLTNTDLYKKYEGSICLKINAFSKYDGLVEGPTFNESNVDTEPVYFNESDKDNILTIYLQLKFTITE